MVRVFTRDRIYRKPLLILRQDTHNISATYFTNTLLSRDPSPITGFPLPKSGASSGSDVHQLESSKSAFLLDAVVLPDPQVISAPSPLHISLCAQEPPQYSPLMNPIDSDNGVPAYPPLLVPTLEGTPYTVWALSFISVKESYSFWLLSFTIIIKVINRLPLTCHLRTSMVKLSRPRMITLLSKVSLMKSDHLLYINPQLLSLYFPEFSEANGQIQAQ